MFLWIGDHFLTGMLGIAGATAFVGIARPRSAKAGVIPGDVILDELDEPVPDFETNEISRSWSQSSIAGSGSATGVVIVAIIGDIAPT